MEQVAGTIEELENRAAEFVRGLRPHPGQATLVTLSGELGAGKTAFVKAAAKALGVEGELTSPTFVIQKSYSLAGQPFKTLIHIDAYRLKSGAELTPLHFDETLKQADNLIMLEWPEMVEDVLGSADAHLTLTVNPDGSRALTYA